MACVETMLPSPTTLQLESLPKTREVSPDEGHMMLRRYHCEKCHYKQSKRYYHKYSNRPFIQTSTLFLCKAGCKFRVSFIRRTEKIDGKRKPVGGNYLHHFIPHSADCCVSTHTLNSKLRQPVVRQYLIFVFPPAQSTGRHGSANNCNHTTRSCSRR